MTLIFVRYICVDPIKMLANSFLTMHNQYFPYTSHKQDPHHTHYQSQNSLVIRAKTLVRNTRPKIRQN